MFPVGDLHQIEHEFRPANIQVWYFDPTQLYLHTMYIVALHR